jgi:hypothetical protein
LSAFQYGVFEPTPSQPDDSADHKHSGSAVRRNPTTDPKTASVTGKVRRSKIEGKQASKEASKQAKKQASKQRSKQASKEASKQAKKQASKEASKQASKEASKQAKKQASKQARKSMQSVVCGIRQSSVMKTESGRTSALLSGRWSAVSCFCVRYCTTRTSCKHLFPNNSRSSLSF